MGLTCLSNRLSLSQTRRLTSRPVAALTMVLGEILARSAARS